MILINLPAYRESNKLVPSMIKYWTILICITIVTVVVDPFVDGSTLLLAAFNVFGTLSLWRVKLSLPH